MPEEWSCHWSFRLFFFNSDTNQAPEFPLYLIFPLQRTKAPTSHFPLQLRELLLSCTWKAVKGIAEKKEEAWTSGLNIFRPFVVGSLVPLEPCLDLKRGEERKHCLPDTRTPRFFHLYG